ncbi:MAG TPA: type II toxin-antitoxin system RelE/ParE family toxin [Nitrososphaera sp.]|jgi:mRNA interferase RelE/StbE|nr:type II toxin-antitoxin system RelE/ParE family toxin [Nitrososphaera sp.]
MTYQIRWTESSFKKLQKLDGLAQSRIIEKLDEAAADPFAVAKKLTGFNLFSIRIGDYRVIVSIEKNKLIVFVIDLGHRSKIYKKL